MFNILLLFFFRRCQWTLDMVTCSAFTWSMLLDPFLIHSKNINSVGSFGGVFLFLNYLINLPTSQLNNFNTKKRHISLSFSRLWLAARIVNIIEEYPKLIRNSQRTFTTYRNVGIKCFVEKLTTNHCQLGIKQWENDGIGHTTVDNYDSIGTISVTDTGWSQEANEWRCDEYASATNWMCDGISMSFVQFVTELHFKWKSYVSQ